MMWQALSRLTNETSQSLRTMMSSSRITFQRSSLLSVPAGSRPQPELPSDILSECRLSTASLPLLTGIRHPLKALAMDSILAGTLFRPQQNYVYADNLRL